MRAEIQQLLDILIKGIVLAEGCTSELANMAALAREEGNLGFAKAALLLSRQHRIKAMELRGQIAALSERHSSILNEDG